MFEAGSDKMKNTYLNLISQKNLKIFDKNHAWKSSCRQLIALYYYYQWWKDEKKLLFIKFFLKKITKAIDDNGI